MWRTASTVEREKVGNSPPPHGRDGSTWDPRVAVPTETDAAPACALAHPLSTCHEHWIALSFSELFSFFLKIYLKEEREREHTTFHTLVHSLGNCSMQSWARSTWGAASESPTRVAEAQACGLSSAAFPRLMSTGLDQKQSTWANRCPGGMLALQVAALLAIPQCEPQTSGFLCWNPAYILNKPVPVTNRKRR